MLNEHFYIQEFLRETGSYLYLQSVFNIFPYFILKKGNKFVFEINIFIFKSEIDESSNLTIFKDTLDKNSVEK